MIDSREDRLKMLDSIRPGRVAAARTAGTPGQRSGDRTGRGDGRRGSTIVLLTLCYLTGCSGGPADSFDAARSQSSNRAAESANSASTAIWFEDVTARTGIDFTYRDGQEAELWTMPESVGGGVAALDYDVDGRIDLFFPGGGQFGPEKTIRGHPSALYRNEGDWSFGDVTLAADTGQAPYYSHGVSVGDYDNDGFPDLLVTGYAGLLLFRNNGDGTFTQTASAAGLNDRLWSCSAAWGDVNGDGHPDLYVVHYVDWSLDNNPRCPGAGPDGRDLCSPRDFASLPDVLYVNNGDGTFRDGSRQAGLRRDGKGLGVLMADIDLDGRLEIYVANDQTTNFLYWNNGGLRLLEGGLRSGTAVDDKGDSNGSMGVDLCDYNLDGRLDIGVSNFERESFALYRHQARRLFQHVSRIAGLTDVGELYVGWGMHFADFDRDGDEDLFVSNGHVLRHPTRSTVKQTPLIMENVGNGRFVSIAEKAGPCLSIPRLGRGSTAADFDNDGDLDLAVSCINEPVRLLSNESRNRSAWLAIRLIGTHGSRDAVGAVVRVRTAQGEQIRQVKGGGSFASANDPCLFFGLGESAGRSATIEQIEIRWPSGMEQTLHNIPAGREYQVIEGRPRPLG